MFFTNYDQTIVKIGEGITIKDSISILRTDDGINLFSVEFIEGRLILDALFYDEHGKVLLEINKYKFRAQGDMLWDLAIVNSGDLALQSNDCKIKIYITYKDPFLYQSGKFYFGGNYITADNKGISFNENQPCISNNNLIRWYQN
jgi:hypothetical protein